MHKKRYSNDSEVLKIITKCRILPIPQLQMTVSPDHFMENYVLIHDIIFFHAPHNVQEHELKTLGPNTG